MRYEKRKLRNKNLHSRSQGFFIFYNVMPFPPQLYYKKDTGNVAVKIPYERFIVNFFLNKSNRLISHTYKNAYFFLKRQKKLKAENDTLMDCCCLYYQFGMGGRNYIEKQGIRAKADSLLSRKFVKLKNVIWTALSSKFRVDLKKKNSV